MPLSPTRIALAIALVTGLLAARPARAQTPTETGPALLGRAQTELRALRYEQAAALLDQAWRAGGNHPDELALLFRLAGTVAVTLGRDAEADAAFRRLAALAPEDRLPDGSSPKIAARLEAAREALGGRALRVDVAARAARLPTVEIEVRSDPARMVASARAIHRDPRRVIHRCTASPLALRDPDLGAATIVIECPPGIRGAVEVDVLDAHGNVLVEERAAVPAEARPAVPGRVEAGPRALPQEAPGSAAPDGESPGPEATPPSSAPAVDASATDRSDATPPFYARGLPWAGVAVGLGAAGLFFGLRSESDQDELDELNRSSGDHDFRDALAVEDRLRRDSGIANAAFVAASAASVVAIVLWVREWRLGRRADARAALPDRTAPVAGAAALTWTVRF